MCMIIPKDGKVLSMEALLSLMVGDEESQVMVAMRDITGREH